MGLRLDQVPEMNETPHWFIALWRFADVNGWDLAFVTDNAEWFELDVTRGDKRTHLTVGGCTVMAKPPGGWSIVSGRSPRPGGQLHACVAFNGVVVHDPHPSRAGILDVLDFMVLRPRVGPRRDSVPSYLDGDLHTVT